MFFSCYMYGKRAFKNRNYYGQHAYNNIYNSILIYCARINDISSFKEVWQQAQSSPRETGGRLNFISQSSKRNRLYTSRTIFRNLHSTTRWTWMGVSRWRCRSTSSKQEPLIRNRYSTPRLRGCGWGRRTTSSALRRKRTAARPSAPTLCM